MEIGYVKSIRGPIVYLDGLPSVKIGDLVVAEDGTLGFISGLLPELAEALIVKAGNVRPGQSFKPANRTLSVAAGDFLFGRVINPLGEPADDKGPIKADKETLVPLEPEPLGIGKRAFIKDQFETGITLIDTIIPIGKGQRELLLGDARSGKSGFLIDIVVNQKEKDIVCVYGCIGKPASDVRDLVGALEREDAMKKTVFVAGFSDDAAPLIYLTPKTALAIACYFQKQGKDVLLIMDDMGAHAKTYREISLLAERAPGREAYPGDIFYEHAHLLERAGSFDKSVGGGSITALPVIELGMTDFTGFISTNIMSMTDGHFLFSNDLYSQAQRPAVDLLLSVSRVGQQTQSRVQTDLAFKVKQVLTEANRLASLTSFSAELPPETRLLLSRKSLIMEILRQAPSVNITRDKQTILLALPFCSFISSKEEKFLAAFKDKIISALTTNPKLAEFCQSALQLSSADELINKLDALGPEVMRAIQNRPVVKPAGGSASGARPPTAAEILAGAAPTIAPPAPAQAATPPPAQPAPTPATPTLAPTAPVQQSEQKPSK